MLTAELAGNLLVIRSSDGRSVSLVRSLNGRWQGGDLGLAPDPNPNPNPDPGDGGSAFRWPFPPNEITTPWMGYPNHRGVDFAKAGGTDNIAAQSGKVSDYRTGWGNGWGNYIKIDHGIIDGHRIETAYAHMITPSAFVLGSNVRKGDVIGHVGTTGNSTGNHLHFEVWQDGVRINPVPWMNAHQ